MLTYNSRQVALPPCDAVGLRTVAYKRINTTYKQRNLLSAPPSENTYGIEALLSTIERRGELEKHGNWFIITAAIGIALYHNISLREQHIELIWQGRKEGV